jgi:hypothetical protein
LGENFFLGRCPRLALISALGAKQILARDAKIQAAKPLICELRAELRITIALGERDPPQKTPEPFDSGVLNFYPAGAV